jgi:hypothetical protein
VDLRSVLRISGKYADRLHSCVPIEPVPSGRTNPIVSSRPKIMATVVWIVVRFISELL